MDIAFILCRYLETEFQSTNKHGSNHEKEVETYYRFLLNEKRERGMPKGGKKKKQKKRDRKAVEP